MNRAIILPWQLDDLNLYYSRSDSWGNIIGSIRLYPLDNPPRYYPTFHLSSIAKDSGEYDSLWEHILNQNVTYLTDLQQYVDKILTEFGCIFTTNKTKAFL